MEKGRKEGGRKRYKYDDSGTEAGEKGGGARQITDFFFWYNKMYIVQLWSSLVPIFLGVFSSNPRFCSLCMHISSSRFFIYGKSKCVRSRVLLPNRYR